MQYINDNSSAIVQLYFENLNLVRANKISEEVWYEICANLLAQIMMDIQPKKEL